MGIKIIKSYMVRDSIKSQYHAPKHAYTNIEIFLKHNTPKRIGCRLKGTYKDYILSDIQYYKNKITYYFTEVEKKGE
jgi:hypothetical protein